MSSRSEYQRAWRARRKAAGIPIHSPERLAKQSYWLAETYHRLRADLFAIVGKVCVGCGLDDVRVMEFDHIADDGASDRKRFKGARSMLAHYVADPNAARAKLQPLCRNCNWLKRNGYEFRKVTPDPDRGCRMSVPLPPTPDEQPSFRVMPRRTAPPPPKPFSETVDPATYDLLALADTVFGPGMNDIAVARAGVVLAKAVRLKLLVPANVVPPRATEKAAWVRELEATYDRCKQIGEENAPEQPTREQAGAWLGFVSFFLASYGMVLQRAEAGDFAACAHIAREVIRSTLGALPGVSEVIAEGETPHPLAPWWAVLGVQPTSAADLVEFRYRHLLAANHPDQTGGVDGEYKRVQAAWKAFQTERGLI